MASLLSNNITNLQSLLDKVNTLPDAGGEQATPIISVNSSGLITAIAGTKSSTHQLAFQPAKTITPSTSSQIAVSSGYYTGGDITVEGDSNLIAENIKSGISIFGISGTLVEGGGSSSGELVDYSENEDAIINKTISNYTNDRITSIGSYAFTSCTSLTSVNFPIAESIGRTAFGDCTSLTSVNFPAVTSIGREAFYNCTKLISINFPKATFINSSAFYQCCNLTSVDFPAVTKISSFAFTSCTSLTSVNFPIAESICSNAFGDCTSLTSVNFPAVTSIDNKVFNRCTRLSGLYLTGSSVCTLRNSNAFTSTPIGGYSYLTGTYGNIYVPASLLTSYQTATNWVYFSSRFIGI